MNSNLATIFTALALSLPTVFARAADAPGVDAPIASAQERFSVAAEFEPPQAVWMAAREAESGHPTFDVVMQMVGALAPQVRVELMVENDELLSRVKQRLQKDQVDMGKIKFWRTSASPTRWYRDVGATFLRGDQGHINAIDFNFN